MNQLKLQEHVSLKAFNTFGFHCYARYFLAARSLMELGLAIAHARACDWPMLVLGGGSNLVLTQDFPGLVVKMALLGIEKIAQTDESVILKVAAGEVWDDFVAYTVAQGYCGLENMSLIPGSVGAAPLQNIGAYGIELKHSFYGLEALERASGQLKTFNGDACQFAYRDSVFKQGLKDQFVITSVFFKLSLQPKLHIKERLIEKELAEKGVLHPSVQQVRDSVCAIRRRRLPDPEMIGNAGSFFTNPFVSRTQFEQILAHYPNVVAYPVDNERMKISAGWLIDACGWRGYRQGEVGVYPENPLVLVNYGQATGSDILRLAAAIKESIVEKFAIILQPEPAVY